MNHVFNCYAAPGATERMASADAAQGVPAAMLLDANNKAIVAITLSVDGQGSIRIAFGGGIPTQGANAVGHIITADRGLIRITGTPNCRSFLFISTFAGTPADVQITPEYETFK